MLGARPIREPGPVQRGVEPVAGPIAGEDAPGPVASVGGGGEPDDHDPCPRIAEAGQGSRPVRLTFEAARRVRRRLLAPLDQPRAAPAARPLAGPLGPGLAP